MIAPQDDVTADPENVIAELRQQLDARIAERDAALAEKVSLAEALATRTAGLVTRNSDLDERIAHQSANLDVLRAMSASPSDPQPVFDLIVRSSRDLCGGTGAGLFEFDGELVHLRSTMAPAYGHAEMEAYRQLWPMTPTRGSMIGRAILDRQTIHTPDIAADQEVFQSIRTVGHRSTLVVPLMRDGLAIGALSINARELGGFSDSQVALLQTFAEQAVIAITSAETHRTLQTRTADLQESLENQTATSEVLKVISRSTFNLQPVLDMVVETAARLCAAEFGHLALRDGDVYRPFASFAFSPELEQFVRQLTFTRGRGSLVGRVLLEARAVQINDITADPEYAIPQVASLGNVRSLLGVPLLREGTPIGVLALCRQRAEQFTDRQIELVSTFADQAVIAIENTRLITEQREALERQTATAEVLQVINTSPGELAPVFDALLEKAMRLCEAAFGSLYTYDGKQFNSGAHRGVPAAYAAFRGQNPPVARPGSAIERCLEMKHVIHRLDVMTSDNYQSGNPYARAMVELGGIRTDVTVPLLKDQTVLGFIQIYRQEVRAFSEKQIALLEDFAAQAVIAMENARLINEQREALEQQTATAEVLQVINASPGNLQPVFEAILEKAHRICGAEIGSLFVYDGEFLRAMATHGWPEQFDALMRKPRRPTPLLQNLIKGERLFHIPDLRAMGEQIPRETTRFLTDVVGVRTFLALPLRRDRALLGTITAHRLEVRPFSEKEIALLENFAAQAVIAMENARLITETREALEQQQAIAEILQVINRSPGELPPVFDILLDKAMRLCEAAFGILAVKEGDQTHTVAAQGLPPALAEWRRNNPIINTQNTLLARVVAGEPYIHTPDLKDDELYRRGEPLRCANVDLGGARTSLYVPLTRDRDVLGTIHIYRQEVRPFTDKQIALLQNFAAQAVIAMENARLLGELHQRTDDLQESLEYQTATSDVLKVISRSTFDLQLVLDALSEAAARLCEAEMAWLTRREGTTYRFLTAVGSTPELTTDAVRLKATVLDRRAFVPGRQTITGRVASEALAVQIVDIAADPEYALSELTTVAKVHTLLGVPMMREGVVVGTISLARQRVEPFTEKQIDLVQTFAAQAVIAMENARLLDEIRRRQEELRITFENMGDGVAMFDETPRLVAWNRKFQEMLDVPDEILAERRTYDDYIRYLTERGEYGPDTDTETQLGRFQERIREHYNFERTRPDGRVMEVRHNPVADGGFVLIYADITERKRNEAEIRAGRDAAEEASRTIEAAYRDLKAAQANLIQAEKMASLGQLTAGIAHEIKNPLNFVNNFAALSVDLLSELRETAAPGFAALTDDQRAEVEGVSAMLTSNLEKITEHGKRADGIVKAMLEHSRGSSAERRMVDLNALIDEALNLAYHGARAQDQSFNITLERHFTENIAPIEVNPQDMTRVFLNIFSNSFYAANRRASDGGDTAFVPTLKVTTRDSDGAVEICVWDNGTGIPADIRDKLFQPFFTTKPTGEGTGLGLSITYDIVTKQHGGAITVDSEVGKYSEFTIRLPRNP